jgi:SpoVK/Ycf46/Vps4 family AAA+-type ATPase
VPRVAKLTDTEMLRLLEYFKGVLILTTNRIKSIDIAMQSRIQYAIRYPELDKPRSTKVWETYANQLNESNCVNKHEIIHWIKNIKDEMYSGESRHDGLNGRDIRNIFTSAETLAYGDERTEHKISLKHIKQMYFATLQFLRELETTKTKWVGNTSITSQDILRR